MKRRRNNIIAGIEAIIFDLDGTLVDSNEWHVESWDRAFQRFGKKFSRTDLREQIGKGSDQYLPEFLTSGEMERFGARLDRFRSKLFKNEYLPRVRPFPKVRELFEFLRHKGKRVVLATSGKKPETRHYIRLLKINGLIDGATSAEDVENSKPAPDIFASALERLDGVSSDDVLVAGDTRFDIEAARKLDLHSVAFLCGGSDEKRLRQSGARAIYRDPADFLRSIKS